MKIVLASGSPRRKALLGELLAKYGCVFRIIASSLDEENLIKEIIREKGSPEQIVERLSYAKAEDVFRHLRHDTGDLTVIGADTIVYFDGQMIGKPKDADDASYILKKIQGNNNEVYTGMTVIMKIGGNISRETVNSKSTVYMKSMSHENISDYVKTGEPLDKAGAYAIQGIGRKFIERYTGDYDSIVGLNVSQLEEILKRYGIFKWHG